MTKEKIKFNKEKETLLVPLYCKAKQTKQDQPIISDEKAVEIVQKIEYDFSELKVPAKTCLTVCMRAKQFDNYVSEFLKEYSEITVVHLGCGLDSRYNRLGKESVNWYDLDFPDVINLRRKFYQEKDNYHFISSSVTNLDWIEEIYKQGKVMFIAEGLLMYLKEDEVKKLFLKLNEKFPGSHFVFDAYSKFTAKNINRHSSIKKTNAEVHWGIDDPSEIEEWSEGIDFVEEWYFTESPEINKLSFIYRNVFKLAGLFSAARKAHRLLYFKL